MFEVLYSISLLLRDGLFFLAHNRFLEYWLLNIPVQGTSQEFCTKSRPTTHSRDGRRFGVYSGSRKYYDNPTKRRVMLLLASKQIAALVEIQTFKSSSNITASLRQHLTLGVKYSYCFFLLLSRQTSPSRVNIYVNQSEDTVRVYWFGICL